uniref:Uncharacterized protein n=1 Tax=Romanomermis culicivorax TaxID=13658 RepID=A0A915KTM1_ROMCU
MINGGCFGVDLMRRSRGGFGNHCNHHCDHCSSGNGFDGRSHNDCSSHRFENNIEGGHSGRHQHCDAKTMCSLVAIQYPDISIWIRRMAIYRRRLKHDNYGKFIFHKKFLNSMLCYHGLYKRRKQEEKTTKKRHKK